MTEKMNQAYSHIAEIPQELHFGTIQSISGLFLAGESYILAHG
jgi:hypothetical protein